MDSGIAKNAAQGLVPDINMISFIADKHVEAAFAEVVCLVYLD